MNLQAVKKAIIFLAEVFRTSTKFFCWRRDSTPDCGTVCRAQRKTITAATGH
jgi:hypothetical protein